MKSASRRLLVAAAPFLAGTAMAMMLPGPGAHGQIIDSPDAPPVSTAPPTPATVPDKPVSTLKVNVDLVNFYFTARGRHGQLIDDLTREDCTLNENKTPQ